MNKPLEIIADLDTPLSAYLKLVPLNPIFLLESVEGGENLARYSFIGLLPRRRIVVRSGQTSLDGTPVAGKNLFEVLAQALGKPDQDEVYTGLRSGFVGYVGYEMAEICDRMPVHQRPGSALPDAWLEEPGAVLVFDHLKHRIRIICAPGEDQEALGREVLTALRCPVPPLPLAGTFEPALPDISRDEFIHRVLQAKEYIRQGDIFQVVPSVRFTGRTDMSAVSLYRALRLVNPSPYLFLFNFDSFHLIGGSPEALVRLEKGRATLMPIAGTRPRSKNPKEDRRLAEELLNDAKENAEHLMLVDLARNDLGRVARPGTIQVERFREIHRFSHVMHLVSTVTGDLDSAKGPFDLMRSVFPAGTVTGAPKIRAMEIIHELEGRARGPYAGSVGYFDRSGNLDQAITIRTLVLEGDRFSFQAGAGIVADSIPEREFEEVKNKGAALEQALTLAAEEL